MFVNRASAVARPAPTLDDPGVPEDGTDWLLKLDYEQTMATYRQFADIRFKLLAFVPALSAAAVGLLTAATAGGWTTAAVGVVGFVVALGIVVYDQRNTQFYNGAISRAQHLERLLDLAAFEGDLAPGLFGSRKSHRTRHFLGLEVSHGLGLALVYSAVLGAWAFAATYPAGNDGRRWLPALLAILVGGAALVQLLLNDSRLGRRPPAGHEPRA